MSVLGTYEAAKEELGLDLGISASDPNYSPKNLDPVTEMTPMDVQAEVTGPD